MMVDDEAEEDFKISMAAITCLLWPSFLMFVSIATDIS